MGAEGGYGIFKVERDDSVFLCSAAYGSQASTSKCWYVTTVIVCILNTKLLQISSEKDTQETLTQSLDSLRWFRSRHASSGSIAR